MIPDSQNKPTEHLSLWCYMNPQEAARAIERLREKISRMVEYRYNADKVLEISRE